MLLSLPAQQGCQYCRMKVAVRQLQEAQQVGCVCREGDEHLRHAEGDGSAAQRLCCQGGHCWMPSEHMGHVRAAVNAVAARSCRTAGHSAHRLRLQAVMLTDCECT